MYSVICKVFLKIQQTWLNLIHFLKGILRTLSVDALQWLLADPAHLILQLTGRDHLDEQFQ